MNNKTNQSPKSAGKNASASPTTKYAGGMIDPALAQLPQYAATHPLVKSATPTEEPKKSEPKRPTFDPVKILTEPYFRAKYGPANPAAKPAPAPTLLPALKLLVLGRRAVDPVKLLTEPYFRAKYGDPAPALTINDAQDTVNVSKYNMIDPALVQAQQAYGKTVSRGFSDPGLLQAEQAQENIKNAQFLSLKGQPTKALPSHIGFSDPGLYAIDAKIKSLMPDFPKKPTLTPTQQAEVSSPYYRAAVPKSYAELGTPFSRKVTPEYIENQEKRLESLQNLLIDYSGPVDTLNSEAAAKQEAMFEMLKKDIDNQQLIIDEAKQQLRNQAEQNWPKYNTYEIALPYSNNASQRSIDYTNTKLDEMEKDLGRLEMLKGTDLAADVQYRSLFKEYQQRLDFLEQQQAELYYQNQADMRMKYESRALGSGKPVTMPDGRGGTVSTYYYDIDALAHQLDPDKLGKSGIQSIVKYISDDNYRNQIMIQNAYASSSSQSYKYDSLNYIAPREKEVMQYYATKGDWDSVQKYYDSIRRTLGARRQEAISQSTKDFANEHKLAGALVNILSAPAQVGALIGTGVQKVKNDFTGNYETVDTNSPWFSGVHTVKDTEEGITEGMSPGWKSLVGIGLDAGQIITTLPFGELSPIILASEAAGDSAYEALENGASPDQALALGIGSGLIDYLVDKIPTETLEKAIKGDTLNNEISNLGVKYLDSYSTAYVSGTLKALQNSLVTGNKSDLSKQIEDYMKLGMTKDAATRKAVVQTYFVKPLSPAGADAASDFLAGLTGLNNNNAKEDG